MINIITTQNDIIEEDAMLNTMGTKSSRNIMKISRNVLKTSSASTYVSSLYGKIISLNSINDELSLVDIILLSRLIYNVATFTSSRTKLDLILKMRWKNHNLMCIKRYHMSFSKSYITYNNKKLKRITNDNNIVLYTHLLKSFYTIYIIDDSITIYKLGRSYNIKRRDSSRDIIWYSGAMILHRTALRVNYIVIDNDVIEFIHYASKLMLIQNECNIYHYYPITKILDNGVSVNVKTALTYIVDEYYD